MSQESQNPDLAESGEILSIKCHKGTEGEYGCTFSLASALVGRGVVKATGKSSHAHGMERWVSPRPVWTGAENVAPTRVRTPKSSSP